MTNRAFAWKSVVVLAMDGECSVARRAQSHRFFCSQNCAPLRPIISWTAVLLSRLGSLLQKQSARIWRFLSVLVDFGGWFPIGALKFWVLACHPNECVWSNSPLPSGEPERPRRVVLNVFGICKMWVEKDFQLSYLIVGIIFFISRKPLLTVSLVALRP